MPHLLEVHRDNFTISTDPTRLDADTIAEMLNAPTGHRDGPRERVDRSLANSLVLGLYDGEKQIGFAHVVSDYAIFAYLCDVFIHEDYRAQGLGKWLMQTVHSHPDLQRPAPLDSRSTTTTHTSSISQFGWDALAKIQIAGWKSSNPFPGEGRD